MESITLAKGRKLILDRKGLAHMKAVAREIAKFSSDHLYGRRLEKHEFRFTIEQGLMLGRKFENHELDQDNRDLQTLRKEGLALSVFALDGPMNVKDAQALRPGGLYDGLLFNESGEETPVEVVSTLTPHDKAAARHMARFGYVFTSGPSTAEYLDAVATGVPASPKACNIDEGLEELVAQIDALILRKTQKTYPENTILLVSYAEGLRYEMIDLAARRILVPPESKFSRVFLVGINSRVVRELGVTTKIC